MNPDYARTFYGHDYNYYTAYRDENIRLREDQARLLEENRQLREKLEQASDFAKISSVTQALGDTDASFSILDIRQLTEGLELRGWSFGDSA